VNKDPRYSRSVGGGDVAERRHGRGLVSGVSTALSHWKKVTP